MNNADWDLICFLTQRLSTGSPNPRTHTHDGFHTPPGSRGGDLREYKGCSSSMLLWQLPRGDCVKDLALWFPSVRQPLQSAASLQSVAVKGHADKICTLAEKSCNIYLIIFWLLGMRKKTLLVFQQPKPEQICVSWKRKKALKIKQLERKTLLITNFMSMLKDTQTCGSGVCSTTLVCAGSARVSV